MSDMAPTQNGNGGPPLAGMQPLGGVNVDPDQTEALVVEVQKTIIDAAEKARAAENGGEFKDYATGIGSLILALYPKGGEISGESATAVAQTARSATGDKKPDNGKSADAGNA